MLPLQLGQVQQKCQEVENVKKNKKYPCFVNRLYPPSARLERITKETVKINGITIPKNMLVMIPVYALQHDPEIWPEPEEFKPER